MEREIDLIIPDDDGWEVVSNIQYNGLKPIELLADWIVRDDVHLVGSDSCRILNRLLREKIYELDERITAVIKEQQANERAIENAQNLSKEVGHGRKQ